MGGVTDDQRLSIVMGGERRQVRSERVRNLFVEVGGDVRAYVGGLLREGIGD